MNKALVIGVDVRVEVLSEGEEIWLDVVYEDGLEASMQISPLAVRQLQAGLDAL